jgi:uncharacterized protein (TIRG00374 family)
MFRSKHVQVALLFLLGVFLIYLSLQKIELSTLIDYIKNGNYWIAFPVFMVSMFGYWIRSLRWKLLLDSMGNYSKTGHLYAALSMGYAVNFATPRLGEITRCLVLKKTDRIPLEQSLISVVIERAVDIITLALIVLLAATLNYDQSSIYVQDKIVEPLFGYFKTIPWMWLLIAGVAALVLCLWVYRQLKSSSKVKKFISELLDSIKRVLLLKQKFRFLIYTFLIWLCYFLMTFLWFYTFDETQTLGLREAFVIMAVGSIGRSVPIQGGGMGAYHYLVSNAFGIFGISLLTGTAMAYVIHGAQLLLTFVLGSLAWVWLMVIFGQKNEK